MNVSGGEQAEMADADESRRQHVHEETGEEAARRQRGGLLVPRPEDDGAVIDLEEPGVGDRDAVGVPAEVGVDLAHAAEGRLGVDDPRAAVEPAEEPLEGLGVRQLGASAAEVEG